MRNEPNLRVSRVAAATLSLVAAAAFSAPTLVTTDVIGATYTNFNGFESAPVWHGQNPASYTEDGINVEQVLAGGSAVAIYTDAVVSGFQGSRSWWTPGDFAYTKISSASGSEISSINFLAASSYGPGRNGAIGIYYELFNDGAYVGNGALTNQSVYGHWLGFIGGGFDEIRIRDDDNPVYSLNTCCSHANGFDVDSIKLISAVPEPGAFALALSGLVVLTLAARRRKAG